MIKEILLLGNPALYEISEAVREEELTDGGFGAGSARYHDGVPADL